MLWCNHLVAEEQYLDNFIEMLSAERSVAMNTLSAYKVDIKSLLLYLKDAGINVTFTDRQHLENYLSKIKVDYHLSGKTIARKISAMRQFFQFLVTEGICEHNNALELRLPRRTQDLPKALSQESIEQLLKTAYSDTSNDGIRIAAMLELLYSTGMRISELLSLKMQSIEHNLSTTNSAQYMLISGKGDKERVVLLHPEAMSILKKYLSVRINFIKKHSETDWLFPSTTKQGKISTLTRQRFGQILKQLAVNSGIDQKLVSPHVIRHSFASHLLQNGANLRVVQELLGHSDISSTQIYTKITQTQAEKLILEKHPLSKHKTKTPQA